MGVDELTCAPDFIASRSIDSTRTTPKHRLYRTVAERALLRRFEVVQEAISPTALPAIAPLKTHIRLIHIASNPHQPTLHPSLSNTP